MELHIEKITYPGKSLGFYQGKAVFTDEGAPGETVAVTPLESKKTYIRAKTVHIITPSDHRVIPRCDHYKICSPYQYLEYPFQIEIKRRQVYEQYRRVFKTEPLQLEVIASPFIWGYRNKIELRLDLEDFNLCYHSPLEPNTHVPIGTCGLISDTMNSLKDRCRDTLKKHNADTITAITIRRAAEEKLLLILHTRDSSKIDETVIGEIADVPGLSGIVQKHHNSLRVLSGQDYLDETCGGITCRIGALSFFQINTAALGEVFDTLSGWIPLTGKETIADLYCGIGTFGLYLNAKAGRLIAVESARANITYLQENLRLNNVKNVSVFHYSTETWLNINRTAVDIIIVDPPRKGLGPEVCEGICSLGSQRIVYISCDLATFLRDLRSLSSVYRLDKLTAFDFFPHTPHIELCALLELK